MKSHKEAMEYASQKSRLHTQRSRYQGYADIVGYTAILFTILVYTGISFLAGGTGSVIGSSFRFIRLWQWLQVVFYVQKIPCTVFLLALASLLYVYTFYKNITRFYAGKTKCGVRLLYLASMLMGCTAIVRSDHWLMWLGIGNTLLGISNLLVGQDKDMSSRGRKLFLSYGGKTAIVGMLLVLLAGILETVNIHSFFSLVLEMVPMAALLIYAFYSHMNRGFFIPIMRRLKILGGENGIAERGNFK